MKLHYITCVVVTLMQLVDGNNVVIKDVANGVMWQLKPYIFRNENGEMEGIIYKTYDSIQRTCMNLDAVKSQTETLEETVVHDSLESFDRLFESDVQYGQGNLTNVTKDFSVWLPIVKEYDRELLKNRSVTDVTFLYSPHIAVIVKKSKISLFYKLQLGIQQTRHIVVISVLCAIVFAILIWVAVSAILFYNHGCKCFKQIPFYPIQCCL